MECFHTFLSASLVARGHNQVGEGSALDTGATKIAVCRTFGIERSTPIDLLARIGSSAGTKVEKACVARRQRETFL